MGIKVKGGMWCDVCQKLVAGQKSTHKFAKLGATVMTAGVYGGVPGGYHCPSCGQPVRPLPGRAWTSTEKKGALVAIGVVAVGIGITYGIIAIIGLFAGPATPHTIPDVTAMSLKIAKLNLDNAHVAYTYDSDQGAFGILDESNWVVCGENPIAGTETTGKVRLDVRHFSC